MNAFDLSGPAFLLFYVAAGGVAGIATFLIAKRQREGGGPSDDGPEANGEGLDPYEAAWLEGRDEGAIRSAVATLVQDRAVNVNERTRELRAAKGGRPAHDAPVLVSATYYTLGSVGPRRAPELLPSLLPQLRAIRSRLEALGLVRNLGVGDRVARALPLLVVAGAGAGKISVGLSRGRPVGLLFVLALAAAVIALVVGRARIVRTVRGDQALAAVRARFAALKDTLASAGSDGLSGQDAAWAVGLFGSAVIGGGLLYMALYASVRRFEADRAGGGTWGGCGAVWGGADSAGGSAGCGGDGGGCGGGGGGGGCGGCGGCGA